MSGPGEGAPGSEAGGGRATSPASERPRARLLVVDDEATQRDMLASILGRAGYEVLTAATGAEALAQLEAGAFDLLLTDQRMPEMDGLELLDRSRRLAAELPVVLMTAYGSVQTAVDAMKRGAAVSICASLCCGEGVRRSRSVPCATVG